jgi:hypothetical protein
MAENEHSSAPSHLNKSEKPDDAVPPNLEGTKPADTTESFQEFTAKLFPFDRQRYALYLMDNLAQIFSQLVNAPAKEFAAKLETTVDATVQSLLYDDSPDAVYTFNKLLFSCFLMPPEPPLFNGRCDAHKAFCLAATLNRLCNVVGPTKANPKPHKYGWNGLNKDAKGWCESMLVCDIPPDLPKPVVEELLRAKWEVLKIVRDAQLVSPFPMTRIDRPKRIDPSDTLDGSCDE